MKRILTSERRRVLPPDGLALMAAAVACLPLIIAKRIGRFAIADRRSDIGFDKVSR
ncbi:hypothetical protein [Marinobacter sp. NFXS9]|uniref:hypothetical protein n=1 Tax=Marinobacter sp. NFXS9 TaxID=2818433 RepID=UPI0032DF7E54